MLLFWSKRFAAVQQSPANSQNLQNVRAKAALTKAETHLREAIAAADDVLLKDQRYAAAKRDLEKAENQAEAAAAKAVAKQRAVAAAQNKVRSEIAEERKEDARAASRNFAALLSGALQFERWQFGVRTGDFHFQRTLRPILIDRRHEFPRCSHAAAGHRRGIGRQFGLAHQHHIAAGLNRIVGTPGFREPEIPARIRRLRMHSQRVIATGDQLHRGAGQRLTVEQHFSRDGRRNTFAASQQAGSQEQQASDVAKRF